jgi:hypothetical protein
MNITALRSYSRVITTKRAGNCHACGTETSPGRDFAAVTPGGKWHAFCQPCAASYAAQVAGLIKLIEAEAEAASQAVRDSLVLPDEATLVAVIQGQADDATAYDTTQVLQRLLAAIRVGAVAEATANDPLLSGLRRIAADATAEPRDRSFAESLVSQVDRGRTLSPKQVSAAERMVGRADGGRTRQVAGDYQPGVYVDQAGRYVKIQRNRQDTGSYGKVWTGNGWDYAPDLKRQPGMTPITEEQARAFGREFHACVFCSTPLTDDGDNRSVIVGYGPICARKFGLPWG